MAIETTTRLGAARPAGIAEIVTTLREVLGPKVMAVLTDGAGEAVLDSWQSGETEPTSGIRDRLITAWEATEMLLEVERPSIIRAWFGGLNPVLEDRPPAMVVAEDPESFMAAAREFRAYG
jgi:hypothetical protein